MDPFWLIDEASPAGVRGAAAAQPSSPERGASLFTRIEQVLGEKTEPDAAFFMDSWTAGVAVASENFLRRQTERKSRNSELPAWVAFSSFTPFCEAPAETSTQPAWSLREGRAERASMANLRGPDDEEGDEGHAADEATIVYPLTLESACRVLGVVATSTREQIRAAYRKMASRHHPDRVTRGGPFQQKLAGDRMASINEAYRLLCAGPVGRWSTC
ncbi:MAG: J domain-containing protein [Acidobacteriaceae bacterium]